MMCLGDNEVVDLVEGHIDDERRAALMAHLDDCEPCRILLAQTARALMPTANERLKPNLDGLPDVGDVIARYRVTARIGAGAMGMVLAAEHIDLRRRVALKVVLADGEAGSAQLRPRLMREARTASAIRHTNVVAVHDVLTLEDGSPVMVMDLLEGETLRSRLLREGTLSMRDALHIMKQVCAGLEAAHQLGIVHRDLKPDNIFIATGDGGGETVKIVDFGIAKLTAVDGPAAETAGLTQTGMLVGTPHYMAPEQAFADGPVDARADLWAVGVMLYECLCGTRPFEGTSVGQVLKRLAQLSFVPIDEVVRGVPTDLSRLIGVLLSERDLRPATVNEVIDVLAAIDVGGELELIATASSSSLLGAHAVDNGSWLKRLAPSPPWYVGLLAAAGLSVFLLYPRTTVERSAAPPLTNATAPDPSATLPVQPRPAAAPVSSATAEPASSSAATSSAASSPAAASTIVAPTPKVRPTPKPASTAVRPSPKSKPAPEPAGPGDLLTDPPF